MEEEVSSMTAILVVLTITAFLTFDWVRSRRREVRSPVPASQFDAIAPEVFTRSEGLFYGPGHTWARLETDGSVRVGIDDFARRLLGKVDRIEAAPAGTALARRDAAFVLHQGGKSVGFAPPIEGRVTAVNAAVLDDPQGVRRDPYGSGWLMTLQPARLAANLRSLRVGEDAARWMREEVVRLRDFLALHVPADPVGATLPDGGEPTDGLLEHFDAPVWERFESEFLAS
jgi:glycine cleavage system H protein